MPKKTADPAIVRRIRRLAGSPSTVRTTTQAKSDLLAWKLTTDDVCRAIQQWIDANEPVNEIVTTRAVGHVGKPAYVIKPCLCNAVWYVKVTVAECDGEYLLLVSAHPDH